MKQTAYELLARLDSAFRESVILLPDWDIVDERRYDKDRAALYEQGCKEVS